MAGSDRKIGLLDLMIALNEHDERLKEHCKQTESSVLDDELRGDIEKLNAAYQLLKWWREFRNQLERLKGHFSPCLAEAARFRGTADHTLDAIGRIAIGNALEQCQQPLKNLTLRIQDSTEHGWKRSDDKRGEGGGNPRNTTFLIRFGYNLREGDLLWESLEPIK